MSSTKYVLKSEDYYRNFKESIKSKDTVITYDHKLKIYMKHMGFGEGQYSQLIDGKGIKEIEVDLAGFVISLKKRNYSLASQKHILVLLFTSTASTT
ncbi:MAG: hypothetical protein ACJ72Q_02815 [Nitrososphaeraceae archaeon]